ncbi:MAG: type II secretion system F family protein [Candidatus Aenigmarchaeota archaeon]|nr:type II secretion system F family protein [Candidatus Aenigmarchaeota archaeon]
MYKSSLRFFGKIGMKYLSSYVSPLKEEILKSNLNILFELYVGRMLFVSFLAFIAVFVSITAVSTILVGVPLWVAMIGGLIAGTTVGFGVLTVYHSYPYQLLTTKKSDIEGNMPFAINHMAAIASAGVPPSVLFRLMSYVPEYGEIANESKRIVRNVEVFGMDLNTAIKNVANRTPNESFRQFLYGIVSSIETGGDLKRYFEGAAKDALFEYRLKREKYLQTLSTYADFYTAVLIAAPLFFISILAVMALIGGSVLGLSIPDAMRAGIYFLIPLLNVAFIIFIHFTQPRL